MPCPEGVAIPEILALCNEYYTKRGDSDAEQEVKNRYTREITAEKGAGNCVKCGQCEGECPQELPIRNLVARAARIFERSE